MADQMMEEAKRMDNVHSDGSDFLAELKCEVLDKVAKTDAHFKSQQRGEPDLTFDEKRKIASDLLEENPSRFLSRFHKYLNEKDSGYFDSLRGNYEVDFYLKEIESRGDIRKREIRVKNRRYEALKKLVKGNEYFSDTEMRKRNPLLYEQMVGRYLTDEEREAIDTIDKADLRFSTILLEHIERDYVNLVKEKQREQEDDQIEESDNDEEEEDAMEEDENLIPDEEKLLMREEFVSHMHHNFLLGKDAEFDYSTVDDNEEYDNLERDGDIEDSYFTSEEPD